MVQKLLLCGANGSPCGEHIPSVLAVLFFNEELRIEWAWCLRAVAGVQGSAGSPEAPSLCGSAAYPAQALQQGSARAGDAHPGAGQEDEHGGRAALLCAALLHPAVLL